MVEQPLQVAIIGCGWAGARHARAFAQAGAAVRWGVDANAARAQALADELARAGQAARVTFDYWAALDDPALEAVDICLPHDLHADVAVAAAQAGKHVLTEKPLADTLDNADRMIAAAERAGVVLMVAENERFSPLYARVRDLVAEGAIGAPALVQMNRECYLNRSFLQDRRWFLNAKTAAGGMMMSGGVQRCAALLAILGDVTSVQSLRAPQRFLEMEGDDTSIALIRFASGAVGTLVESFCMKSLATAAGAEGHTLRIDGDLGHLAVTDCHTIRLFSERPEYMPGGLLMEHAIHVAEADTFFLEVQHFVECVREGKEPLTSGRAQRRPLEIVLAAYRSMALGGMPVGV